MKTQTHTAATAATTATTANHTPRTTSRMGRAISGLTACALLSACATSSKDVGSTYTSPLTYQNYDCQQLSDETIRTQQRTQQLAARLDEAAHNDKVITGVGMLLFWPALFALGGTKTQEAELARLKGEQDALEQASITRKCARQATPASTAPNRKTPPTPTPAPNQP